MRATWKKSQAKEGEWRLVVQGGDNETIYATIYQTPGITEYDRIGYNMYLINQSIDAEGRYLDLEIAMEEAEIKILDYLSATTSAVRRLRHTKNKVE